MIEQNQLRDSKTGLRARLGYMVGARRAGLVGLVAVLVIAAVINLLGRRFDRRWDFTTDHRYTPTSPLRRLLNDLKQDVTITVLLARTDPLAPTLEQLLNGYRTITPRLLIDWVDPDREPGRFLSRQSELGLGAGRTEDGQVTSDSILVVSAKGRRKYIEAEDIVGLDPESGDSTTHAERALIMAFHAVFERKPPMVCFTEGHRELSISDLGPLGLSRFKLRLEGDAIQTKAVDLATAVGDSLTDCRLIVVAAPDVMLSPRALESLAQATSHSSFLLLGGAVPDAAGHLATVGLESLAKLGGISLGTDVVVELDDAFRLPNALGETFLATPVEHPVTRSLLRGNSAAPLRIVVSLAQSLQKLPNSRALTLLTSSAQSVALRDVSEGTIKALETTHAEATSYVLAMAGPLGEGSAPGLRLAAAPANIVQNRTFETAHLLVTQAFALSLISFLTTSPANQVEFESRPSRAHGFDLSEAELSSIARYTVLVMPSCFLLVGLSLLWIRRKRPIHDAPDRPEASGE